MLIQQLCKSFPATLLPKENEFAQYDLTHTPYNTTMSMLFDFIRNTPDVGRQFKLFCEQFAAGQKASITSRDPVVWYQDEVEIFVKDTCITCKPVACYNPQIGSWHMAAIAYKCPKSR